MNFSGFLSSYKLKKFAAGLPMRYCDVSLQLKRPRWRALRFKFISLTRLNWSYRFVVIHRHRLTIHTNCTVQAGKVKLSRENIRE